ncbi:MULTISPECIES: YheC/YheD family protein [unclassified Bacillus (in: firmicutes)]|uniref:YheC/YheD family endospore coat-associated protein n=1 Tax=unclassified Bacillus (in: firmicutes) TaxID=185979 RepID=UPI001C314A95|nr:MULTISPECIES: YheC/YheD family protein [unclassified Bacillus (in: firmicutes)]
MKFEPIQTYNEDPYSMYVSSALLKKWKMADESIIPLTIGRTCISVKMKTFSIDTSTLKIPTALFEKYSLPVQKYVFAVRFDEVLQTLKVGPIIGMLTNYYHDENDEPNFRSIHSFCEELEKGVKEYGGFFYVFAHADFSASSVKGFYYENERWVSSELPLPDVIYNRIHSRKLEQGSEMLALREMINDLEIPYFNERFFSKWEVYNYLSHEDHLLPYLPDTKLLTRESLIEMTNKYSTVFIKPIHGSQGRNILKITKDENSYWVDTSTNHHLKSERKLSFNELFQHYQTFFTKKWCIVQQGIDLIDYYSRQIDFRVLCHRNSQNLWSKTSTVARISAKQQFVSNIAQGGEIMRPVLALSHCFSKQEAMAQSALLAELAIEACSILSQHTSGILGELGVDIGIDHHGKLWIIEINSKPSKNFEDKSLKIRPSAKAIIRFCTSLAFEKSTKKEDS